MNKTKCLYCEKEFSKKGLHTHVKRAHSIDHSWKNQSSIEHREKTKLGIIKAFPNGQIAWNKGLKGDSRFVSVKEFSNDSIFIEDSTYPRHKMKARIIRDKLLEYKCSICENEGIWVEKPLSLQIDHINGINNDNRLENLRFMCPNCHSQTDTYAGKKNKK